MEQKQGEFSGWAIVEILGHATHIGYVETVNFGGASLFRVDTPELPEREYTLTRPEWTDSEHLPAGSKVKREARPAHSVLVGAASIYRITPCDEAAAREAIERATPRKLIVIERGIKAIAGDVEDPLDEEEEDDDNSSF